MLRWQKSGLRARPDRAAACASSVLPKRCEGRRELEMRHWPVSIGVNGSLERSGRLLVSAEAKSRAAGKRPPVRKREVARTEPQRLPDVAFRLLCPSDEDFEPADVGVGARQISVESQRSFDSRQFPPQPDWSRRELDPCKSEPSRGRARAKALSWQRPQPQRGARPDRLQKNG